MKINLFDVLICRTPVFSINDTLPERLNELKLKIAESSPGFFDFIQNVTDANLPNLEERVWFTLWKYFNRAQYRSTPFGTFAGVTILPLTPALPGPIIIKKDVDAVHHIDWSHKDAVFVPIKKHLSPHTYLLTNTSVYAIGNEIRYLRMKNGFHELASVQSIPLLAQTIKICRTKTTVETFCTFSQEHFGIDQKNTIDFLIQLIQLQLLTTALQPNITGVDFFERTNYRQPKSPIDYIISNRQLLNGEFDSKTLKNLPEMFLFFAKHLPAQTNADVEEFKKNFQKKFEHQEVSLSVAMDPEIGIGYGNALQQYGSNELVQEVKQRRMKPPRHTIEYGDFQIFILQKLIDAQPIRLETFKEPVSPPSIRIPNTFSTIFHLYQSKPVVFSAGGCTANALLGRFTIADPKIEHLARQISVSEQETNKEVIFFDIAYQAEKRVDNVNRRKQLYPYELPILTWSTTDTPLSFNDIMVSVHQGEVVLRSKSLGKRLIPRIPSAYNYTRSDLAAYRFLCDLQHQSLNHQLSARLQDLFPDLTHYPRMTFKDVIVSPAAWLLPSAIQNVIKNNLPEKMEILKTWLTQNNINFQFRAGEADHTVTFNPEKTEDLQAFAIYCNQQPRPFYITEALIDEQDMVKDEMGNTYFGQYISSHHHQETTYKEAPLPRTPEAPSDTRHLPGGEWLYFEIYLHPAKANDILLNRLHQLIRSHKKSILKWFFIRYSDPSHHLRCRLKLKEKNLAAAITLDLNTMLSPDVMVGVVTEIKIKTYIRETARYGAQRMDLVEQFFFIDSRFVLFLHQKAKSENQLIATCLSMMSTFIHLFLPEIDHQLTFSNQMADAFTNEMALDTMLFKKINASFSLIKHNLAQNTLVMPSSIMTNYVKTITQLLSTCSTNNEKHSLVADLIHMHINRVFSVDQRVYETILYHYLKHLLLFKRATVRR